MTSHLGDPLKLTVTCDRNKIVQACIKGKMKSCVEAFIDNNMNKIFVLV